MTPKQKLKSIEKKMNRLQKNNPDINFELVSRFFLDIQRYYNLRQEHFILKFNLEHCEK